MTNSFGRSLGLLSGYGRRHMSKRHEFESQCRILDGSFSHAFAAKIVLMIEKTKIQVKKGLGMAH